MSLRFLTRQSVISLKRCAKQFHTSKCLKETFTTTDAVLSKPEQTKILGKLSNYV